jgi:predicted RNA-binding protein
MCLAAAYVSTEGDEPILREIAHMTLDGDTIELETLFGESKVVQGRVKEIDFMKSAITIER